MSMSIPAIAAVDIMMRIESEDQEIMMMIEDHDTTGDMMRMRRKTESEEGGIAVKSVTRIEDVDVIVMIEGTVFDDSIQ